MASSATPEIATLRELRASGWESVPVKEELRRNAVAKIEAGEPLSHLICHIGCSLVRPTLSCPEGR